MLKAVEELDFPEFSEHLIRCLAGQSSISTDRGFFLRKHNVKLHNNSDRATWTYSRTSLV